MTGGAGFHGSHLCERLLKEGCDVLCVDNFYSVTHLVYSPHFDLMRHDMTFPLYVEVIVYEPALQESEFFHSRVVKDLARFKQEADIIVADRMVGELLEVAERVCTRDMFGKD